MGGTHSRKRNNGVLTGAESNVTLVPHNTLTRQKAVREWTGQYHCSCIDLTHQSHTLDPTPEVPFPKLSAAIRLSIKDKGYVRITVFEHNERHIREQIESFYWL